MFELGKTLKRQHFLLFSFIQLFFIAAGLNVSAAVLADEIVLDRGWEYYWGDSPLTREGVPQWILEDSQPHWQPIAFPANPPARDEYNNVWFRVTLPDGQLRDPVFYASSIDLLVEAYLDGELVYRHGQFDENGAGKFVGWPWHMITLPSDFAGKTLYFRVFSNYIDIGFWGEVKVSDRVSILNQVVEKSTQGMVVAGISLFIALMAAAFAMLQGERRQFLSVCFFSLAAAGLVLGDIPVMKLIWNQPLLWNYIGAYAYFLLPIPMFMLLVEWLSKANVEVRHFQWLWQFHLVFLVLAGAGSLLGIVSITQLYPVFDGIFTVTLLLLAGSVLLIFRRVSLEQKVLILAYFGFCAVMMLDMAVAHRWVSWSSVPVSSGALMFSVVIIGLSFNHYLTTQRRLTELNLLLETKVEGRTEQLAVMAEKERLRSDSLQFQQTKLEIIDEITLGLESCHTLEAGINKVESLIAELCQPFSGVYRVAKSGRWPVARCWGDYTELAEPDSTLIKQTHYNNEHGFFSLNIINQQGLVSCVAILQLQVTEAPQCWSVDSFMQLLQRGMEKISITLANIVLREELQRFSYEDELTGLKNRRFFSEVLDYEVSAAERNKQPLSLLICDVDFFKQFNDAHGHSAGDEGLKIFSDLLSHSFRQADIVCRFGGEEFVVIMPMASADDCLRRAEQLMAAVASTQITYEGEMLGCLTISIGIASWPELIADPGQLVQQADLALYEAKNSGRNCIRMAKL